MNLIHMNLIPAIFFYSKATYKTNWIAPVKLYSSRRFIRVPQMDKMSEMHVSFIRRFSVASK